MPFYTPVQNVRAFRRDKPYDQIAWSDFKTVVDEFHGRIDRWYIEPTKKLGENGHFAFPVMAMTEG